MLSDVVAGLNTEIKMLVSKEGVNSYFTFMIHDWTGNCIILCNFLNRQSQPIPAKGNFSLDWKISRILRDMPLSLSYISVNSIH